MQLKYIYTYSSDTAISRNEAYVKACICMSYLLPALSSAGHAWPGVWRSNCCPQETRGISDKRQHSITSVHLTAGGLELNWMIDRDSFDAHWHRSNFLFSGVP